MARAFIALVALSLAACGASPCSRVCQKLDSCGALALPDGGSSGAELACEQDCENPPGGGHTCTNEDAIASCFEAASCEDLTSESSRLKCPSCE